LDRGFAITRVSAIKYDELPHYRPGGELLPAQVDVIPGIADQQSIPEVDFFTLAGPDLAFNDLGRRIEARRADWSRRRNPLS
jgi:hypothetical protein